MFTYGTLALVLFSGGMTIGLHMMQVNLEDEKIKPYINSLETKKTEVENLKLSSKVKETKLLYTKEKQKDKIPVSITLKNDNLKSLSGNYQISKTLNPGEQPYVEYQELKKPIRYFTFISHKQLNNQFSGFDKGLYNVNVFVPKDYKLDF